MYVVLIALLICNDSKTSKVDTIVSILRLYLCVYHNSQCMHWCLHSLERCYWCEKCLYKVAEVLTLESVCVMSISRAGRISWIVLTGGGGSLLLHRLTITQVTLRKNVIGISGFTMKLSSGFTTPSSMTKSRRTGPSPMILPKAQTACSQTFSWGDISSCRKTGTAPACTTLFVCAEVPDAIFVKAQAVSNWSVGLSALERHCTRMGRIPVAINSSIGGFLSEDRSFLHCWTAASCTSGLSGVAAFITNSFKSTDAKVLSISSSSVE